MSAILRRAFSLLAMTAVTGCGGIAGSAGPLTARDAPALVHRSSGSGGSLGPVLTTSDGGAIYGFAIDQNGNDGILASNGNELSLQTFDATTGKITKTFGIVKGRQVRRQSDYVADGIFENDIALVDFMRAGIAGKTPTHDMYKVVDPVTGEKISGTWTPPVDLFDAYETAVNQSTKTGVMYGYQREGSDSPELIVYNVAKNTGKVIQLNFNDFFLATQPQLAQDTVHDQAVMATSPSAGRTGGPPPVIFTINLRSGKVVQFSGIGCDDGSVGCGYANGIAYDSSTGIACTDTELDGGVEFYDVAKQGGMHELLPNGGGQVYAGWSIANDPVNQLFLVAQPFSSTGKGSSIQVYDEDGTFVESINGFSFGDETAEVAVNPNTRTGWAVGPLGDQLQEFSY